MLISADSVVRFSSVSDLLANQAPGDGGLYFAELYGQDFPADKNYRLYAYIFGDNTPPDGDAVLQTTGDMAGRWFRIYTQKTADWASTAGDSLILNKPSIPTRVNVTLPTDKTIAIGSAYQATDNTRSTIVNMTLESAVSATLTGTVTASAVVRIGPTSASVATSPFTGSKVVARYKNSQTVALAVGISVSQTTAVPFAVHVPAGYYYSVTATAGTVSVSDVTEQPITVSA